VLKPSRSAYITQTLVTCRLSKYDAGVLKLKMRENAEVLKLE